MTWGTLLAYCLAKPGAWQDEPKLPKKDRPLTKGAMVWTVRPGEIW
jgi:hypothetical protein